MIALFLISESGLAVGKKEFDTWILNIVFVIGTDKWDTEPGLVKQWAQTQIETAERVFSDKPKLKINPTFHRIETLGGQDISALHFRSSSKYRKWMDKYADNRATSKTEGYITVLIVDEVCLDNSKR